MKRFPCLETETFAAYIADNSQLGIHRPGYNGVASLIPKHSGNNLFVPRYAGLNYEIISLAGAPPYEPEGGRCTSNTPTRNKSCSFNRKRRTLT